MLFRNNSLERMFRRVFFRQGVPLVTRVQIRQALDDDLIRDEIEYTLSRKAAEAGVVPPQAFDADGLFVGNWITDLLDWVIEHWDEILEIIMTIISLFAARAVVVEPE